MWDEHWEFDAPCVVYSPFVRYRPGGNAGEIDRIVEDIAFELTEGRRPPRIDADVRRESEWRGWSLRGFARRRAAWHVVIRGKWVHEDGFLVFTPTSRRESWGPPRPRRRR